MKQENHSMTSYFDWIGEFLADPQAWLQDWIELVGTRREQGEISQYIVDNGIKFRGERVLMVLVAAVFAAVGLYKDNGAYILGGMLASPMMLAIQGQSYALYACDDDAFWGSFKSFIKQFGIGLGFAVLYFAFNSLLEPTQAIWDRTYPDANDALVAFSGGLLSILAAMHSDKTSLATVFAAVAIGTSLMPPICAVGYGIATGQGVFVWDAFWLFLINTVMIMLANIVMIWIADLPKHEGVKKTKQFVYGFIVLCGFGIGVYNSIIVGKHQSDKSEIHQLVHTFLADKGRMTSLDIDPRNKYVEGLMVTHPNVSDSLWVRLEQAILKVVPNYNVSIIQVAEHYRDDRIVSFAQQQKQELTALRSQLASKDQAIRNTMRLQDSLYQEVPMMLRQALDAVEGVRVIYVVPVKTPEHNYQALVRYRPKGWQQKQLIEQQLDSLRTAHPNLEINRFE